MCERTPVRPRRHLPNERWRQTVQDLQALLARMVSENPETAGWELSIPDGDGDGPFGVMVWREERMVRLDLTAEAGVIELA